MLGKRLKYISFFICFFSCFTIIASFLVYKFHSHYKLYPNLNWDSLSEKIVRIDNPNQKFSFLDCPKFEISRTYYKYKNKKIYKSKHPFNSKRFIIETKNRNFEYILFELNKNRKNFFCVKNNFIVNSFLINFPNIEKLLIKNVINNNVGFSLIKNPFLYGEITISKSARLYSTSKYLFKPLLIFVSILVLVYWFHIFIIKSKLEKKIQIFLSKKDCVFGFLSAIFLFLHVLFIDKSHLEYLKKLYVFNFIFFTILSQHYFVKTIALNKRILTCYLNIFILSLKKIFVKTNLLVFMLSIIFLLLKKKNLINVIEWNFMIYLSLFYLLTMFLWKKI